MCPRRSRRLSIFALMLAVSLWNVTQVKSQQSEPAPKAKPDLVAERLREEINELQAQVTRLHEGPDAPAAWKELRKLSQELEERSKERSKENDASDKPLDERVRKLSEDKTVLDWQVRIHDLKAKQRELNVELNRRTRGVGIELFAARHEALARQHAAPTPQLQELRFDVRNFPKIDGSTSTQPLAVLIACRTLDAPYAWTNVAKSMDLEYFEYLGRVHKLDPLQLVLESREQDFPVREYTLQAKTDTPQVERMGRIINHLLAANASTHQAYVNVIEGRSDLGLLARGPSTSEKELAKKHQVELEVTPCALDALVFLVNEKNNVRNLTTRQIQEIYSGKITNWQDLGGTKSPITAFQREEESGSQELMKSLVMKKEPLVEITGPRKDSMYLIGFGMVGPYLALTWNEHGLGYSVYYYERFMSGSPRTRTISIDGVEPNSESITKQTYPFVSDVYVVTRKNIAADSPTSKLRKWLLSAEGQQVVRESGYVPLRK